MSEIRYALIGAHLVAADVEGIANITPFEMPPLVVSGIEIDANRGIADPMVVRRALEARKALIERETFIAIRYGVSVSTPDEARAKCAPHLARWRGILEKWRGMVEITLRIAGSKKASRPDRREMQSGSEYLRALHRSRASQVDPGTRHRVEAAFRPIVAAHRWVAREDGGTEFAALIRRADLERTMTAGTTLQAELPAVPFLLSGPWPLEVFADE